jgi:ribosomal protein S18 acetylase RimI-like enzyme
MTNLEKKAEGNLSNKIKLRGIIAEDKEEIRNILLDVGNFTQVEVRVALSLIDERFKGDEDYNFLIAELENRIIGYACYGPSPMTNGTWDIYWMAVLKEFQGNKIGSFLTEVIEDEIRKRRGRLILIETSSKESYDATRTFYEKKGYRVMGKIERFYSETDDKIIYGKYLK